MDLEALQWHVTDVVERYHRADYFPSACVRVFDSEKTLAVCCVGDASPDSLFDAASLTKIATATQILTLVEQETISLDETLPAVFPEISGDPYLRERLKDVTLYQLLTHTSTMTAWYPFYSRLGEGFFQVLRYALQHTEPTSGVCYSDLNFMLLGILLEKVCGMPLEECLQKNLVQPLHLGAMTYRPPLTEQLIPSDYGNAIEMRMCRDRGISFDGFRPLGQPVLGTVNDGNSHYYFSDVAGHAGIFATAEAYERLCRFYMNTESPLLKEAQQEQKSAPGRGIGFQTGMTYPHGCGHTGFTGTSIYFSSEANIGAVAFTNRLFYLEGSTRDLSEFRRALHKTVFAIGAKY